MIDVLRHKTYRALFFAQMISLIGTGLTTVALGLLAFELAGEQAGSVLGAALAIKMIAYVGLSPIMGALTAKLPRRLLLVTLNAVRAAIVVFLPFVTEVWQIYVLIFLMQSASAAYTPAFQAVIPSILKDEDDYTKALSLSRLTYDLENLVSPVLAAALLGIMSFDKLFLGTTLSFIIAALMILTTSLPIVAAEIEKQSFLKRITSGVRVYFATPGLRGLMAVNLVVAAAGAMVIVNTVVIVQHQFSLSEQNTALALAAFGGGSMIAALMLPPVLKRITERSVMLAACVVLFIGLMASTVVKSYAMLLILWGVIGFKYALAQIPSGRLLKRASNRENRSSVFVAQFSLSHLCWLVTYPIAGWVGANYGLSTAAYILAAIACAGLITGFLVWPREE